MMKSLGLLVFALHQAAGFPNMGTIMERGAAASSCGTNAACNKRMDVSDQQIGYDPKNPTAAQKASAARNQGGFTCPITIFNEQEQYVSTTGDHAYIAPGPSDIRGPCPGLNAAANHNYLPRNGVASIAQTVEGLGQLYGMSVDLSGFLAAYAIAFDGDYTTQSWSIGGPPPSISPLGYPEGISYSHNKYEGDTSIARCDAYVNDGDAHSLSPTRFAYAFEAGMDNDRYTMDKFARAFTKNTFRSEAQNPYYFAPLFSTTLVSPAAYNFIIVFMSNHTAAQPDGYLNGDMFKQWFGVSGNYPNFKWMPGQERIPDNWYRRPSAQPYTAPCVLTDLVPEFTAYPHSFRFGGNTNGPNTYTGIDIQSLSGGAYDSSNLLEGDNLGCFFYQSLQQGLPDALTAGVATPAALNFLMPYANKAFGSFSSCPQMSKLNDNNVPPYPGRHYMSNGTATNC